MLMHWIPQSRRGRMIAAALSTLVVAGAASFGGLEVSNALSGTAPPGHVPLPSNLANAAVRDAGFAGADLWALTTGKLEVSQTGASWGDVTPQGIDPTMIRGAYFKDNAHGWVAVSGPDGANGVVPLLVYRTTDRGQSWQVSKVDSSILLADSARAAARFSFVDASDGWLEVDMASSASFSDGNLYRTTDGGTTWTALHIPVAGAITFVTASDGFVSGGVEQSDLYATHDGGASWQAIGLPPVPGNASGNGAISGPLFTDKNDGVLTATANTNGGSTIAIEETSDGGATWAIRGVVKSAGSAGSNGATPIAATGSGNWLAATGPGNALQRLTDHGASSNSIAAAGLPRSNIGRVTSLASEYETATGLAVVRGGICEGFKTDCHEFAALFETNDGGSTWHQLTP